MTTTELFQTYQAAEAASNAAHEADAPDAIALGQVSDRAFAAWRAAVAEARTIWQSFPAGARKSSAETNAEDTEGCAEDELRWFDIAIRTYEMDDCTR
jgi:hypothetical protein